MGSPLDLLRFCVSPPSGPSGPDLGLCPSMYHFGSVPLFLLLWLPPEYDTFEVFSGGLCALMRGPLVMRAFCPEGGGDWSENSGACPEKSPHTCPAWGKSPSAVPWLSFGALQMLFPLLERITCFFFWLSPTQFSKIGLAVTCPGVLAYP